MMTFLKWVLAPIVLAAGFMTFNVTTTEANQWRRGTAWRGGYGYYPRYSYRPYYRSYYGPSYRSWGYYPRSYGYRGYYGNWGYGYRPGFNFRIGF